jgi:HSP20 family protein
MAEKSSEGTQSARGSQSAAAAAASGAQAQSPQSNQGSREQQREQREQQGARRSTDLQRRSWAPNVGSLGLSPFSLVRRMMEDMDLMLDLGPTRTLGTTLARTLPAAVWAPAIEMFQRDGQLVVRADLPGMSPDDVRIEVTDDTLTIEGERRSEVEIEDEDYYRSERTYGRFSRVIALPDGVDADNAQARFENGVLEVTIPLAEEASRGRRLEIQGGAGASAGGQQQQQQKQPGQTGPVH